MEPKQLAELIIENNKRESVTPRRKKIVAWAVLNENGSVNCLYPTKDGATYECNRLKKKFKHGYAILELTGPLPLKPLKKRKL